MMPPPARPPVPAPPALASRVPWREKLAFGAGGILDNFGNSGLKNIANPIFNLVLGVNPALVGVMISTARIWDAFVDPVVGSASDNARTRWGRRKPFIAAGAVGCALTLPLMIACPAGGSETVRTAWLMATGFLFYTAYAVFVIPFNALAFELTSDTHERTRVLAAKTIVAAVSGIGIQWIFPLVQNGWLGAPIPSVRIVGVGLGVVCLIAGLLPLFFVRERLFKQVSGQGRIPLRESLSAALHSGPFRRLLLVTVLTHLGMNTVNALGIYVNVYYVFGGEAKAASVLSGWAGTSYLLATIVSTPLIAMIAARVGKRRTLLGCLGCALAGTASKWVLYDPAHPWWQLGVGLLLGPGLSGLWMLVASMTMDVVDYEELRTGRRTEAIFVAVSAWVGKCGLALSLFLSGLILVAIGFDTEHGSAQHPETLLWMRGLFSWMPAIAVIGSLAVVARFPLTTEKMREVRTELEQRRGAAQ